MKLNQISIESIQDGLLLLVLVSAFAGVLSHANTSGRRKYGDDRLCIVAALLPRSTD